MKEKKFWIEIKNRFNLNKIFLYVYSNSFNLFIHYIKNKKFKTCKILRNSNYILFYFIFFTIKSNMRKIIFLKIKKLLDIFALKIVLRGKIFIIYFIKEDIIYFMLFDTQTVSETEELMYNVKKFYHRS